MRGRGPDFAGCSIDRAQPKIAERDLAGRAFDLESVASALSEDFRAEARGNGHMLEQAELPGEALQTRARNRRGRNERKTHLIGGAAHQAEHGLDGAGIRLPEV